jgi:hypothetical protein
MKPAEIFLRSAVECEHLAKFVRDSQSKAAWSGMAERWLRNAELFERKEQASRPQNRGRTGSPMISQTPRDGGRGLNGNKQTRLLSRRRVSSIRHEPE